MLKQTALILLIASSSAFASEEHQHGEKKAAAKPAMQSEHAMHDHKAEHKGSAVGMAMSAKYATKTVNVNLTDAMKIEFDQPLDLYKDDIVHFIVTNQGEMPHEFSVSSLSERKKHAEMMKKMPNMKHDEPNILTLEAGETAHLTWHFTGQPRVIFACNIPGHSEAGMLEMTMVKADKGEKKMPMKHDMHNH